MNLPAPESEPAAPAADGNPTNPVALIGLVLTLMAGLMCGLLFSTANGLTDPGSIDLIVHSLDTKSNGAESTEIEDPETQAARHAEEVRAIQEATEQQQAQDAIRLQVLLLGSATIVLNLVGLVLSVIGLLVPHRPRGLAVCGTVLSLLLFAGVFGVMAVGAMLNPAA